MLDFQLFRFKVHPAKQRDLFIDEKKPSEILNESIRSNPSVEMRRGVIWQIGNVEVIDNAGLYFRIGRTTKTIHERYEAGKFIDEEIDNSPYTHGFLDSHLEVAAIARKTKLSPDTLGIAKQLVNLLKEAGPAIRYGATFEVGSINDPTNFLEHLREAYAITRFMVTFTRPNSFDVNRDFIKPLERTVEAANAQRGKAELEGQSLDAEKLEEITRSAAATGDDASASVKTDADKSPIRIRLKGNPAVIQYQEEEALEDKRGFLDILRQKYRSIRSAAGETQ